MCGIKTCTIVRYCSCGVTSLFARQTRNLDKWQQWQWQPELLHYMNFRAAKKRIELNASDNKEEINLRQIALTVSIKFSWAFHYHGMKHAHGHRAHNHRFLSIPRKLLLLLLLVPLLLLLTQLTVQCYINKDTLRWKKNWSFFDSGNRFIQDIV